MLVKTIKIINKKNNAILFIDEEKITYKSFDNDFTYEAKDDNYQLFFRTLSMKAKYRVLQEPIWVEENERKDEYQIIITYDNDEVLTHSWLYRFKDLENLFLDIKEIINN